MSETTSANGSGMIAVALVVLFVVAVMMANGVIDAIAWHFGRL